MKEEIAKIRKALGEEELAKIDGSLKAIETSFSKVESEKESLSTQLDEEKANSKSLYKESIKRKNRISELESEVEEAKAETETIKNDPKYESYSEVLRFS